jgi:predicted DNA-binding ribbon-helix-helix protein
MNSTVKKRSIVIGSHKTSVSLEDSFWTSPRARAAYDLDGVWSARYSLSLI